MLAIPIPIKIESSDFVLDVDDVPLYHTPHSIYHCFTGYVHVKIQKMQALDQNSPFIFVDEGLVKISKID